MNRLVALQFQATTGGRPFNITLDAALLDAALLSEVFFGKACLLHHMSEQACLECLIAVNRDRESHIASSFPVDVMATLNTQQCPALTLKYFSELFAGY